MYNMFTVLNSAYMLFGKIWLNSLYENTSQDKINKVFILDTGLTDDDVAYLKKFNKVEIVTSDIDFKETSNALLKNSIWLQHVLRKTKFFRKVLREGNIPLVMVDSDCMFLKDFDEHINSDYDVQVCNRSYHDHDNWIASFFVANNVDNGLLFMNLWISRMKKLMREKPDRGWFESHSLNLCLNELREENEHNLKVGDVFTKDIACEVPELFNKEKTKILHFKGTGNKLDFTGRINRFQNNEFAEQIQKYIR